MRSKSARGARSQAVEARPGAEGRAAGLWAAGLLAKLVLAVVSLAPAAEAQAWPATGTRAREGSVVEPLATWRASQVLKTTGCYSRFK